MSFADRWREHLRLAILLLLTESKAEHLLRRALLVLLSQVPGRGATASLLSDGLDDFGLSPTRDQINTALAWLGDQGAIALTYENGVMGALILTRGLDVAGGRTDLPGIAARPSAAWLQERLSAISLRASLTDVETEAIWLSQVALINIQRDDTYFATATGRDVALGREQFPGVKMASPETVLRAAANAASNMLRGG